MKSPLVQMYAAIQYVVGGGVVLRVGQRSRGVDRLLARRRASSCVFLTACDPFSTLTSDGINRLRQRDLQQHLVGRGIAFTGVAGGDVLAFNLSRPAAAALGRRYRQDAVVYARRGRPAELILLRFV